MENTQIQTLIELRAVVGYLGEKEQFGWWQSSFYVTGSQAFLTPIFPRTLIMAQLNGITQAAARVHDEHIGIGYVYHLFRLPEEIEQEIHRLAQSGEWGQAGGTPVKKDVAIQRLERIAGGQRPSGEGPVRIGNTDEMQKEVAWQAVAGEYMHAFMNGRQVFPYFSNNRG